MKLINEIKAGIDGLTYEQLLSAWRNAPTGDERFKGESGKYWEERMHELRSRPGGQERHVAASKSIEQERQNSYHRN